MDARSERGRHRRHPARQGAAAVDESVRTRACRDADERRRRRGARACRDDRHHSRRELLARPACGPHAGAADGAATVVRSRAGGRADRGEPRPWAAWLLHHSGAPCSGSRARLQRVPHGEHPGRRGGTAVEAGRCAAGSAGPAAARAAAIELSPRHQARTRSSRRWWS